MDRRTFLKTSGWLGAGLAACSLFPVGAEAVKFNRNTYKVSRTRLAMGTFVSITAIHSSKEQAEEATGRAFEEVASLSASLTRYQDTTAVGMLNREGFIKDIPPELAQVIDRAVEFHRLTEGAFDVSVKPVVDLYQECFSAADKREPSEQQLNRALELVGFDKIRIHDRSIRFAKPGMGITLDGIAKGYIVDRASDVLRKHGVENFLINAGGDIRTMGHRRDRKPWAVAIQDPWKREQYPDVVHMANGAIATSGNYEVYFDREKVFHHIIDPAKGLSPRRSASVSVRTDTAMDADALSTAVFVLEPVKGVRFINAFSGAECYVIDREKRTFRSAGWNEKAA